MADSELMLADMTQLAADPSAETRATIARKVAAHLSSGLFSENESVLALDILRLLARDIEVQVRSAVAAHISDCLTVPHGLVLQLAHDISEVAAPLLVRSYILSEEDLIALVRGTRELAKLLAIAKRARISTDLSEALLETDQQEVLHTVLSNSGAALADWQLFNRWERIAATPSLLTALVEHGGLSLRVAERLQKAVSQELKERLCQDYRLPPISVEHGMESARAWAALELSRAGVAATGASSLSALVKQLHRYGCLSSALVVRALCTGDLAFFEAAMAQLAGLPRAVAHILLADRGSLGFRTLYKRARLPEHYFAAIAAFLEASLTEAKQGGAHRRDFASRVQARIQAGHFDRTIPHMDYLLGLVGTRRLIVRHQEFVEEFSA